MTPSENRLKKSHDPVGKLGEKVMTPSENQPKIVMILYEIWAKNQLYQVNFGQKSHDPVTKPVEKSHEPVVKPVKRSHDPVVKLVEKSHEPIVNLSEKKS